MVWLKVEGIDQLQILPTSYINDKLLAFSNSIDNLISHCVECELA